MDPYNADSLYFEEDCIIFFIINMKSQVFIQNLLFVYSVRFCSFVINDNYLPLLSIIKNHNLIEDSAPIIMKLFALKHLKA